MWEQFRDLMMRYYDLTDVELTSDIKHDVGLNSFDFVNLACLIEDEFGVQIDETAYRRWNTVEDVVRYIDEHRTR